MLFNAMPVGLSMQCLLTKCLSMQCLSTKCFLVECLLTKCLSTQCRQAADLTTFICIQRQLFCRFETQFQKKPFLLSAAEKTQFCSPRTLFQIMPRAASLGYLSLQLFNRRKTQHGFKLTTSQLRANGLLSSHPSSRNGNFFLEDNLTITIRWYFTT